MRNVRTVFLSVCFLSSLVSIANAAAPAHPGGLFKSNEDSSRWMVQCQGCNKWLMSTQTPYEPAVKVMDPSAPAMTNFHMLTCAWFAAPLAAPVVAAPVVAAPVVAAPVVAAPVVAAPVVAAPVVADPEAPAE